MGRMIEREEFERIAEEVFDTLPEVLQERIENVHIVVEDQPSEETKRRMKLSDSSILLGLYEGVPLNRRGTHYGSYPVVPDKVTLYQKNIESAAGTTTALREKIREVLIHEIGHYYGMTEEQVRDAGY